MYGLNAVALATICGFFRRSRKQYRKFLTYAGAAL